MKKCIPLCRLLLRENYRGVTAKKAQTWKAAPSNRMNFLVGPQTKNICLTVLLRIKLSVRVGGGKPTSARRVRVLLALINNSSYFVDVLGKPAKPKLSMFDLMRKDRSYCSIPRLKSSESLYDQSVTLPDEGVAAGSSTSYLSPNKGTPCPLRRGSMMELSSVKDRLLEEDLFSGKRNFDRIYSYSYSNHSFYPATLLGFLQQCSLS